jgi:hypothetical protein
VGAAAGDGHLAGVPAQRLDALEDRHGGLARVVLDERDRDRGPRGRCGGLGALERAQVALDRVAEVYDVLTPVIEPGTARASRAVQVPLSTAPMNASTARLKASGSSRLMV